MTAAPQRRPRHAPLHMREDTVSDVPKRWWQWLLMYPTLAIALAGAVPQYYQWAQAFIIGVPTADVNEAREQAKAWERNVDCLHDINHIKPSAHTAYSIDLVACLTGDILLTLTPLQNPDQSISRWIVTKTFFTQIATKFTPSNMERRQDRETSAATAGPAAAATPVRVVDIKTQGRLVTRRIQLSDNTCIDETIDSYTGRHLSQTPAPCTKF
jgi:hypothetical protein